MNGDSKCKCLPKSPEKNRGTATGGGTTRETNQRLALSWLSHDWKSDPKHNGSADATAPLLDAAIVGKTRAAVSRRACVFPGFLWDTFLCVFARSGTSSVLGTPML